MFAEQAEMPCVAKRFGTQACPPYAGVPAPPEEAGAQWFPWVCPWFMDTQHGHGHVILWSDLKYLNSEWEGAFADGGDSTRRGRNRETPSVKITGPKICRPPGGAVCGYRALVVPRVAVWWKLLHGDPE